MSFVVILLAVAYMQHHLALSCPHSCSGHGDCLSPSNRCRCWAQNENDGTYWLGADCSLQGCPYDVAWYDAAASNDVAHKPAECSARGLCDYSKGVCKCQAGFEGRACQRLSCPNGCSGHGTCLSLESYAHSQSGHGLSTSWFKYNSNWDHDKLYGCRCDPNYTGYDCSQRVCPFGDDPMSGLQEDEVQTIFCKALQYSQVAALRPQSKTQGNLKGQKTTISVMFFNLFCKVRVM